MVFIYFILCAAVVVYFSIKLSNCADWFEKHTRISGALVGFLLAATTSIPELVSGLTAVLIKQEEIAISSILGSNLFNYNIVATANLAFIVFFAFNKASKNTHKIVLFILSIYSVVLFSNIFNFTFVIPIIKNSISYISIIIIVIYIFSFKAISEDEVDDNTSLAPKYLVKITFIKFMVLSVVLVIFSSLLAILVEDIVEVTNMKASLAGSVLLGASTSLPEFVGAISLMRLKQYDIAISSVLSSNLFNFFVFAFLDFFSRSALTSFFESGISNLVYIGFISTFIFFVTLKYYKSTNKYLYSIPSVIILAIYFVYITNFS